MLVVVLVVLPLEEDVLVNTEFPEVLLALLGSTNIPELGRESESFEEEEFEEEFEFPFEPEPLLPGGETGPVCSGPSSTSEESGLLEGVS